MNEDIEKIKNGQQQIDSMIQKLADAKGGKFVFTVGNVISCRSMVWFSMAAWITKDC